MQVQKTTLENLFTHERRHLVPLFQRPYVWTEEEQWAPLWDDLRELADRELELAKCYRDTYLMTARAACVMVITSATTEARA